MNRIVRHLTGMAAVLGLAGVLLAAGLVRAASDNSASVTSSVTVTIPGRVGILLQNHPTALQPGADYPPESTDFPYWVVSPQFTIKVFSNKNPNKFKVTVDASGTLPDGLTKSDFYVVTWGRPESTSPGAPQDPANGNNTLPAGWVALGDQPVNIVGDADGRSRTTGWESYNAKLALKLSGDEPETSGVSVTFTYTISVI